MTYAQEQLDLMTCARAGCSHKGEQLEFRSMCHPDAPLRARYLFDARSLVLTCVDCGKGVVELAVAVELPPGVEASPQLKMTVQKPKLRLLRADQAQERK